MEQWHYAKNGKKIGPVSDEVLARLAASGEWNIDLSKWRKICLNFKDRKPQY